MESAYSQMLAELAAAMEEDEKAEWLENERNASDLQSRTPEPGTPIQQEQLQTSDQGDPAQQFPDQTPGHASYYGGGTAPAYSDPNPGVKNCPAYQEDHEEEEASNPEWPFDSHRCGCPATYASSATESSSFWENCTPTRTRIIKICSCHYQKEKNSMTDQRMH